VAKRHLGALVGRIFSRIEAGTTTDWSFVACRGACGNWNIDGTEEVRGEIVIILKGPEIKGKNVIGILSKNRGTYYGSTALASSFKLLKKGSRFAKGLMGLCNRVWYRAQVG